MTHTPEPIKFELTDAIVEAATVASINVSLAPYGEAITTTDHLQGGSRGSGRDARHPLPPPRYSSPRRRGKRAIQKDRGVGCVTLARPSRSTTSSRTLQGRFYKHKFAYILGP